MPALPAGPPCIFSELPADQHHPTCQTWALSVCLQVLLSAGGFKEGSSALLIPGTASGMYHHPLCQQGFIWMCRLLCSSWAVGVGRQRSSVPLGEKPLLEIWAGSSPAECSDSPTGRLWQGWGGKTGCVTLEHQARNEELYRRARCIS